MVGCQISARSQIESAPASRTQEHRQGYRQLLRPLSIERGLVFRFDHFPFGSFHLCMPMYLSL